MRQQTKTMERIKKLTAIGMFAALAYVIHFIHIPVGFLNLDFKDVIMTVSAMYFGPLSGLVLAILVPLLEFPTSETGVYGLIMNVLSSVAFVGTAGLIYRFKKTMAGAVAALISAVLAMTSVMMLANLWITPMYMVGTSASEVAKMIPTVLLPFNAIKAILNASLTLCLYKPLTMVLRKTGFGKQGSVTSLDEDVKKTSMRRNLLVWIIGGSVALISLFIIFFVMDGTLALF